METSINQAESQPTIASPLHDLLKSLGPHFVQLTVDPELDMALVVTLACPGEWVCYGTPEVRVLAPLHVTGGVLVRLAGVGAEGTADAVTSRPGASRLPSSRPRPN
jgi:hypothetical protein